MTFQSWDKTEQQIDRFSNTKCTHLVEKKKKKNTNKRRKQVVKEKHVSLETSLKRHSIAYVNLDFSNLFHMMTKYKLRTKLSTFSIHLLTSSSKKRCYLIMLPINQKHVRDFNISTNDL